MSEYIPAPHTAITTWSGFLYQGKIALLQALKLLCDNKSTYSLQLDSYDDFAFLEDDQIISIHQVKAKKCTYYSTYSKDIANLKENAEHLNCADALFHVAVRISNKSVTDIEDENAPVKMYKYENGNEWCSIDEVDSMIEDMIKKYFEKYHALDGEKRTSGYLVGMRQCLEDIVYKKILHIHKLVHESIETDREAARRQIIPLNEFLQVLNEDLSEQIASEEYYFFHILKDFHRHYQEFCLNIEEEDVLKRLDRYMFYIEKMDKDSMLKFMQNLTPHRKFKLDKLKDYKDSLPRDDLRIGFLRTLKELRETEFDSKKNSFLWKNSKQEYFSATAIARPDSASQETCRDIVENALDTNLETMFDGNNLITSDLDVESIVDKANNIAEIKANTPRDYDKIMSWRRVSLIKLEKAKEKIDE